MDAICYISPVNDPWFNLAVEEWIFNDFHPDKQVLFLWRNSDSVIIGRNQNPWAECDLARLSQDNVNLVRRQSGGGAVFQDLGNTNFTFLSSKENYSKERNFSIITNSLKKLGINAEQIGRNDIQVEGFKISGSAFKEKIDRAFHHGTLLINVDLGRLASYLTPSKKKLDAKGTQSVRARVKNLAELNPQVNHDLLTEAIMNEFFSTYQSETKVEVLDEAKLRSIPEIMAYHDLLKNDSWRLGETPDFQHNLEEKFDWGLINIHLDVHDGKISNLKIFSDALDTNLIEQLHSTLLAKEYHPDSIKSALSSLKETLPNHSTNLDQLESWLVKEII